MPSVYRQSHIEAAGFKEFPKDTAGFLDLCKAMKAKGTPAGFAHGKAVGDGNNYVHWLLWSHGGKMVDEKGVVAINSPETIAAINYAKALYETFIPGTESWQDINNNRAFLAGQVSLTANGVSLYYAAKKDEKLKDMVGRPSRHELPRSDRWARAWSCIRRHKRSSSTTRSFPNACKAYLKFMYEAEQMNAWITGSSAYCCQPLKAFASNPVWTADPMHAPYAKASETLRPNGYAGPLGYASAAVMADYVLVDMFAAAVTGAATPEEACNTGREARQPLLQGLSDMRAIPVKAGGPHSFESFC